MHAATAYKIHSLKVKLIQSSHQIVLGIYLLSLLQIDLIKYLFIIIAAFVLGDIQI